MTDNKGVIKEISSLGFAYFSFTKENLSSNEKYIDDLGVAFTNDIYEEEGFLVNLVKKQTYPELPLA
jgi:hypothetical protein